MSDNQTADAAKVPPAGGDSAAATDASAAATTAATAAAGAADAASTTAPAASAASASGSGSSGGSKSSKKEKKDKKKKEKKEKKEKRDKKDKSGEPSGPRFVIKKWNACAMWSWDNCTDTCAICRNKLTEPSIEYQVGTPSHRLLCFALHCFALLCIASPAAHTAVSDPLPPIHCLFLLTL